MTIPDAAPPPSRGKEVLVEFPQDELIAKWEEFFEEMGYLSKIIAVADRYPESRSLEASFLDLNRFDTDMAIYLLRHPLNVLMAGEEAIRRLVPPGDEAPQIHLRINGLPRDRRVQIRDLRAKHLGQYISVEGLVRKSTEVRPKVVGALFQCLRCGTIIKEEQDGQTFREPLECYEEQGGCKRSASATKFKLLTETSLYLDTQKIEVQESPEGLRGGEEPQRLTAYVEDDLTGRITPGQRVILNGVLRSVQRGRPGQRSTLFDIFVDVNSVEMERVEFEEIEVTEEDAHRIREIGSSPDIFRLITASIAPSIYGMHVEKEALALQLFGGVAKLMPDGRRIRGDIHLILVRGPGRIRRRPLDARSGSPGPRRSRARRDRRDRENESARPVGDPRSDGAAADQCRKGGHHGRPPIPVRDPRRREPEVRPVRRAQVHLRTNRLATGAAEPVRHHLLDHRSPADRSRSRARGAHPQRTQGRRDPAAPRGGLRRRRIHAPRGTFHSPFRPGLFPEVRRLCEAHLPGDDGRGDADHREEVPGDPEDRRSRGLERPHHPAPVGGDHPALRGRRSAPVERGGRRGRRGARGANRRVLDGQSRRRGRSLRHRHHPDRDQPVATRADHLDPRHHQRPRGPRRRRGLRGHRADRAGARHPARESRRVVEARAQEGEIYSPAKNKYK